MPPLNVTCQLSGHLYEEGTGGVLIDKNKHKWRLCPECVSFLWGSRQQKNMEDNFQEDAIDWVLEQLRNNLLGGKPE